MSEHRKRVAHAAVSIFGLALGATFVFFGLAKLFGAAGHVANFERWGFPVWLVDVIGLVEVGGGLALVGRTAAPYAASLLLGTMVGAVVTHLHHGEVSHIALPLFLGLVLAGYGWLRRPAFLRHEHAPDPERPSKAAL